jgi:hypothetical protein
VRSTGLTASQIDKATGTFMGGHYITSSSQPAIMTRAHLDAVRHFIDTVPDWVEAEVDIRTTESEAWKSRPVVTKTGEDMFGEYEVDVTQTTTDTSIARPGIPLQQSAKHNVTITAPFTDLAKHNVTITAPFTDLAKQWQGWGTALKPAHEPAVLARKPLCGTVADNVTTWGVGALNIDGTRVEADDAVPLFTKHNPRPGTSFNVGSKRTGENSTAGRWPANVIFDEAAAQVLDEQSGERKTGGDGTSKQSFWNHGKPIEFTVYKDSGGASRFFYIAKASRAEREAGLDAPIGERANRHPTIKPLALMRYLVRLVTPKGGKVLDPFMGSGSTGCAAVLEGFDFVGIDITPEYVAIAQKRIAHYAVETPLEGIL